MAVGRFPGMLRDAMVDPLSMDSGDVESICGLGLGETDGIDSV